MQKQYKIWLFSLIIILILAGLWFFMRRVYDQEMIILPLKSETELLFFPQGKTAKEIQREFDCDFAVNGSYFWGEETGTFYPAGIWYEGMKKTFSWENRPFDPNLTNTLRFYQKSNQADFLFEQEKADPQTGTILFNAGPQILQSWTINKDLGQMISHWSFAFPRTIIAKDSKNQLFLILFLKGQTLSHVAEILQSKGFSDAINLDGGPSTAFKSKEWRKKGWAEEKVLPIFFCSK